MKQELEELDKNMAVFHVTQVCVHPAVCDPFICVHSTAAENQQASEAECQIEFILF